MMPARTMLGIGMLTVVLAACLDEDLTSAELAKLTGRAGFSPGPRYAGTVYNGNNNVTVTEIDLLVSTTELTTTTSRTYRVQIKIPPLSAQEFSFPIIPGEFGATYSWSIAKARGRP